MRATWPRSAPARDDASATPPIVMNVISAGPFHAPMCLNPAIAAGRFSVNVQRPRNTVSSHAPARSPFRERSAAPPIDEEEAADVRERRADRETGGNRLPLHREVVEEDADGA